MEISSDPYEQKLYHMFKSHDTDCIGSLDVIALTKLCKSLELNDKGNVLIGSLLTTKDSRVTFKDFKEALLNFLGTQMEGGIPEQANKNQVINGTEYIRGTPDSPGREVSPKLVMGTKKYGRRSRPQSLVIDSSHSDSDNESVPVVPSITNKIQKVQRSSSQSEIHNGTRRRRPTSGSKLKRCASLPAQKNIKPKDPVKISQSNQVASSVESLGNLDFENLSNTLYEVWTSYGNELGTCSLNRTQLESVCERVGLHKIAGKVAEEVFEKLDLEPNAKINFIDFIGLIHSDADGVSVPTDRQFNMTARNTIVVQSNLNEIDNSTAENELHDDRVGIPGPLDMVEVDDVINMWEAAGILQAKDLFQSMGFTEDQIHITDLLTTLEDELRGLNDDSQISPLLRASLALRKAEIVALQKAFRQVIDENMKLHSNNRDANQRVALLAQEIDERHATLEDRTKAEIRVLEQRHAEVVRDLTSQLANDRENWSNLNARLESRIRAFEQEEHRFKTELHSLKDENSALEKEQISLQKQVTELLETNIKLNNEIIDVEERQRNDDSNKGEKETEEVLELIDKITCLQIENTNLRDKNDELVAELESINFEILKTKSKKSSSRTNLEVTSENLSDDPEHSSLAVKRRGDSPSKTRIPEESPRLGKLRKCNNDNSESETSGDWVALNSELGATLNSSSGVTGCTTTTSGFSQDSSSLSDSRDEELKSLKEKIIKIENELSEYKNSKLLSCKDKFENVTEKDFEKLKSDKETFESRSQELESSLEQMRKAYDDCEDYWQSKLTEERQLFEKERQIYEEEQQESDKKFGELMEKVREYEEQFSKEGRLSPIEEKDILEQQYADLEAEAEEVRENARKIFEEKTKEVIALQEKIKELQIKLGENIETSLSNIKASSEIASPASSPISYLWNQSTIQAPARDYQNPNWNSSMKADSRIENLSTSETTIFSTTELVPTEIVPETTAALGPIQKPISPQKTQNDGSKDNDDTSSIASAKSFESQSAPSSIHKSSLADSSTCNSPNNIKEELKRLKFFEVQLKEQIKDLAQKRDSLVMELQQLQEAKPVLEKAYARAAHPTLLQRVNHLEQKNRHLQTTLKQQQQYTESIMHQTWQQQRSEISELRNRLDAQAIIMTEQAQRLANADILVKDLYVENSHLAATIQRLEQQRSRTNLMHQHQGLSGVPGMP